MNKKLVGIAKLFSISMTSFPDRIMNLTLQVAIADAIKIFEFNLQRCVDEGVLRVGFKRQSLI